MIYIFKGDDTTFADVKKFLTFNIQTSLDLTGWRAEFILDAVTKTIDDISNKFFEISLDNKDTNKLRYGFLNGTLRLYDDLGKVKTVSNTIPFKVVDSVIENEYENIDLNIPNSCQLDLELNIGKPYDDSSVISINGQTGRVVLEIPELVSQLQNDLGYQTLTDVMGIIASIPQFKLSIVNDLPETGEKMTLYLVPKTESEKDVYNEYIWIEQVSSFELIGTTAVDLTDYVKKTDYATSDKSGVIKLGSGLGIWVNSSNQIHTVKATNTDIDEKKHNYKPIVPSNLNYAVNSVLPTMTQAEYDALETKDENLFYMIVEE